MKKISSPAAPIKLYLGRQNTPEGFTKGEFRIDDLTTGNFKLKAASESVEELSCEHLFHLVPGPARGKFMDEISRVLITGGKANFSVPYYSHMRSVQDFMHAWPPVCEASFLYFNKQWREQNKIDYPLTCDFDFTYGYQLDSEAATKNDETRTFWIKHYTNSITDLMVSLTKK